LGLSKPSKLWVARVPERTLKQAMIAGVGLILLLLLYTAYTRPWYFTSQTYLGALLLLELLVAAVWMYRRIFFPLVIASFLFAGLNLPVGGGWTTARWIFLGVGAGVGLIIMMKEPVHRLGVFHLLAGFTVLAALISAAVSHYPTVALLKTSSLLLLFLYTSTGVRLAVAGREQRFFHGLLIGCEVYVAGIAAFHLVGIEAMGNPNSLGAVIGVVASPILLWGTMLDDKPIVRQRRMFLYAVCVYLLLVSHSRASIGAAVLSFGLLTLVLRKYRLLIQGFATILILIAAAGIFRPEAVTNNVSNFANDVVYKGGDREQGVFASRQSTWQAATDRIRENFWFGTGFGTTDTTDAANVQLGRLASSAEVTAENGSSYLAVTEWVGLLGVLPFLALVIALLITAIRTLQWILKTGNPNHPAFPLALVIMAGLLHAGFEDWLFAPGYYLCVFYWSLAFVLNDLVPSAAILRPVPMRATMMMQPSGSTVAPSR
jgi:O-antigen ligase